MHNVDQCDRSAALRLPAGKGRKLAQDMESFLAQAKQQVSHAFETKRYVERRQQLGAEISQRREPHLAELDKFARERGFGIDVTPNGIIAVPVRGDRA